MQVVGGEEEEQLEEATARSPPQEKINIIFSNVQSQPGKVLELEVQNREKFANPTECGATTVFEAQQQAGLALLNYPTEDDIYLLI